MTVLSEQSSSTFNGAGNTGPFTWTWRFLANADISVMRTVAGIETQLVEGVDYTLSGAGSYQGGSLTLNTALAIGQTLYVERNTNRLQGVDLRNQKDFAADSYEDALDKQAMVQQDGERERSTLRTLIDSAFDMIAQLAAAGSALLENFSLTFKPLDIITKGPWLDARAYPTFAEAVAAASAASKALMFSVDQDVTANLVIPANVELLPLNGAKINHGAYTISYAGSTERWPLAQIFNGTGAVTGLKEVRPAWFGAVGDDSDEAQTLVRVFAAGAGTVLSFAPNKVYRSSEPLLVQNGTVIDLNGSTLRFACVGAKRNLGIVGSNVTVKNGRVENVVGTSGQEGTNQTPIVVAKYTELAGHSNIILENLAVTTVTPQGNGIAIFGDSHDIVVRNIVFPDSAYIGVPILVHWSFNEAEIALGGATVTSHPHNIKIENIRCGDLTYGLFGLGNSVVFLSAAYNVDVSNVYVKSFPLGRAITVYAGDWGFQYSPDSTEQSLGATGITLKNVSGKALIGLHCYMKNPLGALLTVWPSSIVAENFGITGYGSTNSESKGVRVEGASGLTVKNCKFDGAYAGVLVGAETTNLHLLGNSFVRCYLKGFDSALATGSSDFELSANRFEENNQSNTASTPDLYIKYIDNVLVSNNTFNSPYCAYNIRIEDPPSAPANVRLIDNVSKSVKADGTCFSIASQSVYQIVTEYRNNRAYIIPSNGIRGGQRIVPIGSSAKFGGTTPQYVGSDTQAPTGGTWNAGDVVYNSSPSAGGTVGWVCVAAGTPGTWKTFGAISV